MNSVRRMAIALALSLGALLAMEGAAGIAGDGKSFCGGFKPETRTLCRGMPA